MDVDQLELVDSIRGERTNGNDGRTNKMKLVSGSRWLLWSVESETQSGVSPTALQRRWAGRFSESRGTSEQ
jgi:hypothetical protein